MTFLDLGGPECTVLQCGETSVLIDAGSESTYLEIATLLSARRISNPDVLFLSHPHSDHAGGAISLIRHYTPKRIVLPPLTDGASEWDAVTDAAAQYGCEVQYVRAGDDLRLGDLDIRVLAPKGTVYSEINDYSLVLHVFYGSHSFLFTGDAHALSEREILEAEFDLHADVLKVAHHGSESSTSQSFAKAVRPEYALFSIPPGNTDGHPAVSVTARLEELGASLLRTDRAGSITLLTDGTTMTISTEK